MDPVNPLNGHLGGTWTPGWVQPKDNFWLQQTFPQKSKHKLISPLNFMSDYFTFTTTINLLKLDRKYEWYFTTILR